MKLPKALNEATAGAALKYHIKRALERSHSISDFSKQLELSAKNAKFSNNTLKIIEELNNGVKQASEEIKEASKKSAEIKRDFSDTKLSNDEIKDLLNNAEIPTSGRDAITFGVNNLNPEIVEFLHKNNKKMIIEKASNKEVGLLQNANFKHPENIRASLDHDAIAHILKRHGVNSVNVKNGESPVTNEDIANYRYIVNHADAILRTIDKYDKEAITAFKQVNGYAVVVEQAINKKNELVLKTMFKSNGDYKNNDVYKEFSSTSLDANAKVPHGLSSHSGATDNPTPKPLTDQEDLLKNRELDNETPQNATNLSPLEQANAKKLLKEQRATTPLKEFGTNYPEFALKPKEALEKLLQEKNGQVAGAAFRDDLGGIDFVWGKDGEDGYGLAHILEKREKQYTRLGLNAEQIKERTDELLKSIPEVIENGTLFKDDLGHISVELNNIRVGLKNTWDNNNLNNHFVVTSYERDEKVLRELETKPPLSNDYKDNSNYSALNLNENNSTKEGLTSQETPLSILEKSQLEKEKKLESERLAKAEKERAQKIKDKEQAELRDKIRAQKNATLGKSELDREIAKSENIPYKELENAPKTSVSLNDDEIYPLKFVIVNKSDLKPNFKNTGTQTRTAVDSKKVEEIAKRFDPKLIVGRGGFDDLPIILTDGQVIAGNHRIQGMLNFTAESRKKYEQALKENFNIRLKPNELLVRMPEQELNDKEILKLASKSNENRINSFSDTLLSAMSSYNDKLKHLPHKFESDSVENLANQVARVLERDAKHPSANQVENANLCLLSHYARNTPNNSFLEVFDNAYKNLDREQFKAFKEMFANNSANFHNLNNDTMIKNFTISPYLTDALDTTAKMLKSGNRFDNFSKLAHDIDYLVNSTDENGMNAFIKENKDAYNSVISQLLGSSFARFLRLENPSAQFYEFLVKAKEQMIENASNVFTGTSKPISQINVFDFIKYGIESGKSSKESMELIDLLPELEKKFNAHEKFLKGSKK
ncbi:DUF3519 domain-containing protein [Helicobacter pylori]|uniref:DUF3519 domain-containing protein n=1 Tax=Helicobacter pylori TaxID=210 RepID=UPI000992723C|nr:DUF3519 domain-containing protein [Helicobacter pylori]OOQ01839.1 hypothetical protein B0X46_07745 [Helicobacter pylori]OOQ03130.1 hypothetical protein B0X46_05775 [Helicobacter pylori]OOQ03236.1 hypothetical protein B0X46_05725 [Helicobacter pylori]OOQ03498.1 hypothetical protein B0X46_05415 [Helicobacter pylori]PDW86708.1 hypothetical protein BB388_08005 [Helicobacter pylori]